MVGGTSLRRVHILACGASNWRRSSGLEEWTEVSERRDAPTSTPDEWSAPRIGRSYGATLTGDGAVDDGSVSENIEEARLRSGGNPGEAAIPVTEEYLQLVAQLSKVAEARL